MSLVLLTFMSVKALTHVVLLTGPHWTKANNPSYGFCLILLTLTFLFFFWNDLLISVCTLWLCRYQTFIQVHIHLSLIRNPNEMWLKWGLRHSRTYENDQIVPLAAYNQGRDQAIIKSLSQIMVL